MSRHYYLPYDGMRDMTFARREQVKCGLGWYELLEPDKSHVTLSQSMTTMWLVPLLTTKSSQSQNYFVRVFRKTILVTYTIFSHSDASWAHYTLCTLWKCMSDIKIYRHIWYHIYLYIIPFLCTKIFLTNFARALGFSLIKNKNLSVSDSLNYPSSHDV